MLTTVLVNTIPGVPLIYTGEEVANDKRLDLFEKVEVDWTRSSPVGDLLKKLSMLRRNGTALSSGMMKRAKTTDDDTLYAFLRSSDKENLLIILNMSRDARNCRLTLPGDFGETTLKFRDVLTDEVRMKPAGQLELVIDAIGGHGFRLYSVSTESTRD
jgi:glycosidase